VSLVKECYWTSALDSSRQVQDQSRSFTNPFVPNRSRRK